MSSEALTDLQLDPARAHHITILGRKGTGKSVLAKRFWDTYPFDRLVIDPTGDVDAGEDAHKLTEPLPSRWPITVTDERTTLDYKADPSSPMYEDELDRAAGLAFHHGKSLLWIDEVGELTRANKTRPHFRRVLHQSRHRRLSLLLCGPRPIDVNPLVLSQADYLALFELPNPRDRERVADAIGVELRTLEDHLAALDEHGYVWWSTGERQLTVMPPLPLVSKRSPPPSRDFVTQ